MIKLLADENIPPGVVGFLLDRGFDVKEVGGTGFAVITASSGFVFIRL
jgi:hypothetical protein